MRIGLDGVCFTDHNKAWEPQEIRRLAGKRGFLVIGGIEVDTVEGHVLVFGLQKEFSRIIRVQHLRTMVSQAGGVMIAAHPFKSFLVFGVSDLSLSPNEACQRPIFQAVDAVEGFSGKVADKENFLAQEVARMLRLPVAGGSDAHSPQAIGKCVTIFEQEIRDEAEFLRELKRGRFQGAYLRR